MPNIILKTAISLGLDLKPHVLERAQCLLEEMDILPLGLVMPNSHIAKPVICLQLSCESLREKFTQHVAYTVTKLSPFTYTCSLNNIRFTLGFDMTFLHRIVDGLPCMKPHMRHDTQEVYYSFRINYSKELRRIGRIVNWTSPKYAYVIVYVYCQLLYPNILKSYLLQKCRTQIPRFDKTLELVRNYSSDILTHLQTQANPMLHRGKHDFKDCPHTTPERKSSCSLASDPPSEKPFNENQIVSQAISVKTDPLENFLEKPESPRILNIPKAMVDK
ncbi:hypothetical protein K7432_008821 [Basidiobolus ranarum]|uniref:ORC6 first cyclin-like domain-containing protein n=1 Tax=Basidiobolus ranarum TaxID=34480 RepID=A0ABR2WR82_9FUNG